MLPILILDLTFTLYGNLKISNIYNLEDVQGETLLEKFDKVKELLGSLLPKNFESNQSLTSDQ